VMVLVNKEAWLFHGGVVDGHSRQVAHFSHSRPLPVQIGTPKGESDKIGGRMRCLQ
jgi:hypothetical protein